MFAPTFKHGGALKLKLPTTLPSPLAFRPPTKPTLAVSQRKEEEIDHGNSSGEESSYRTKGEIKKMGPVEHGGGAASAGVHQVGVLV